MSEETVTVVDAARGFVVRTPDATVGSAQDDGLHVVLVHPEIPGNTGSIGRLCAGTNVWLHLIEPLAFALDNRYLKRAGLDYWPHVKLCVHESFDAVRALFPREKMYFFSKKATTRFTDCAYSPGSVLVFGCETRGLSDELLAEYADRAVAIPTTENIRSINLANAASIAVYEALRQVDYAPLK